MISRHRKHLTLLWRIKSDCGKAVCEVHKAYDGLLLDGYKHYRIYHHKNEFARGKNHVNGIESFWSYTKRRLAKFNGFQKSHFLLHLKESQWRWNMRVSGNSIYHALLETFRNNPL